MKLKKLNAMEELSISKKATQLLPELLSKGLEIEDAMAIAHNTATLFFALGEEKPDNPNLLLYEFSLGEIADFCKQINSSDECGFNDSFEEEFS